MSLLRSPSEIVDYMAHHGTEKARMPVWRLGLMAVLGGMFIGLGTLLAMEVAGGATGLAATNPGLVKLLFGAVFPLGFIAVTLTGVDLFTSNCAGGFTGWWQGGIGHKLLVRFWVISFVGNAIGAVATAWLFGLETHLLTSDAATQFLVNIAQGKVSHPFWMTFTKGLLANMLVCVASMQGYSAKDTFGRMLGIWFPVMAFVTLGMEHSIANLFIIPAAMMAGADISMSQFIIGNLIPATLGNLVGGALMIGLPYALIYLPARKSQPVSTAEPEVTQGCVPDLVP
ncbi:formate/nitrite transporter [Silvimonas terrae]|uniref:Formate/nitrite transporter n=1 Tax=Silvimonas terrae TaxID=300266 RepID=A0A840RE12_9NEIS|nr:formate/nitrite transporter family protein [Silvimonas terrae]MBB5191217.1 formate/nitrite transporter [Silvimonas terrae]